MSFYYLEYFMMGYVLRKKSSKNTILGIILILVGIFIELILTWLRYLQAFEKIADSELEYSLINPYAPMIVFASLFIFIRFTKLNTQRDCSSISSLTYLCYLFHAGVWDIGLRIIKSSIGKNVDNRIFIPICVIVVFLISTLLAKIYQILWSKLAKNMQQIITHSIKYVVSYIGLSLV